jgi:hypothetical protein
MMKSRLLMVALVPVLGLGSLLIARNEPLLPPLFPGTQQPASRPASPPIDLDKPPQLGRTMHTMERLIKSIAAQVDNKAMDRSTLADITKLQIHTALAKSPQPDSAGQELSEAEKKAIADYRARIIALLRTELALEEAILADNRAAAHEALKLLAAQRKDGHAAFGVDDDHH